MIPLAGSTFPHDATTLHAALAQALLPLGLGSAALEIEGALPNLSALRVNLTDARFHRDLPSPQAPQSPEPSFVVRDASVDAEPAHFEALPFHLHACAEDAVFAFTHDNAGAPMLAFTGCSSGALALSLPLAGMEGALLGLASEAAAKQGTEIQSVKVELVAESPRTLRLHATATAKAMFFTATLSITGRVEITDSFAVRLSGLECAGDGMIANLAAGYLRPRLAALEGRSIALQTLAPGICDVAFDASEGLRITAKFGSK